MRLLGSLMMASVASFALALLKQVTRHGVSWSNYHWDWAVASVAAFLLFVFGFRARRTAEVKYVYMNTLVAFPLFKHEPTKKKDS